MGFHGYCILPAGITAATGGIDGATVRAVAETDIAAWVSEHPQAPAAGRAAIEAHDRVVRAAMTETVTPVPLRFGQWFEDEAALHAGLREGADSWRSLLTRFAGAVEMGLRVHGPLPESVAGTTERPGTAFLQKLSARGQALAALRSEVASALAGLAMDSRSGGEPDAAGGLWLAHLVRRADLDAYRAAVAGLESRLQDVRIRSSGPWPPYTFAA